METKSGPLTVKGPHYGKLNETEVRDISKDLLDCRGGVEHEIKPEWGKEKD